MAKLLLSAGRFALVDDADFDWLNQWKWTYSGHGYAHRGDNGKKIYMHKLITGWDRTDHIDEDGLNNQRYNLRESSAAENGRNRGKNRNNSTGYKGVFPQSGTDYFFARIVVDRKPIYLGAFKTSIDAALAYNEAAIEYHGEFAKLNKVEM